MSRHHACVSKWWVTAAERRPPLTVHLCGRVRRGVTENAAIQRAVAAGARCIEHGHLMDVTTAKLMVEKNIWLSTQPFVSEDDTVTLTGQSRINLLQVIAGTEKVYSLVKEYKIKTAFGSNLLFSIKLTNRQGLMPTHLTRWYDKADILRMATSINAELLAMSGARNPYEGALGVIEETALADLLVVDGNPIDRIDIVATPEKNFVMIMKDGEIYKNTMLTQLTKVESI